MENYLFLQQYWWFIVSLLGAILVFLLFVQGGNSLLFQLGKTEEEQCNRTQMGVHLYNAGHLRRSLFRLLPSLLQHQFRRGILAMDADTFQFRIAGRFV